jgi:hypothetical protein
MSNQLLVREPEATAASEEVVRIYVDHESLKRLGAWTEAGRFAVSARYGAVTLDLRGLRLPKELDIELCMDRAVVKLLLPEDAVVDHRDIAWSGRGRVKDAGNVKDMQAQGQNAAAAADGAAADTATGTAAEPTRVRLHGSAQQSEIRVQRGGMAQLTAICSREFVQDALRARKAGTFPTVDDPTRTAMPAK